jgi:hypothetical protein
MKKTHKIRIFILLIFFFACASLSFTVAMGFAKAADPSLDTSPKITRTPLDAKQQKVLLIRVNKLDTGATRLFSIWYAAISYNDPTRVIMKSLYPGAPGDKLASALKSTFGLNGQGDLNKAFIDSLVENKIEWNAYIIADTEAVKEISQWATGKEAKVVLTPPDQSNQVNDFLKQDSDYLTSVCQQLIPQNKQQAQRTIDWQTILSTHMQVSYGLPEGLVNWQRLTAAHSMKCSAIISH